MLEAGHAMIGLLDSPVYTPEGTTVVAAKTTDVNKISVPLPLMLTVIGIALAAAAGVWRIETQVGVIENAIKYEREMDRDRAERQTEREAAYRQYIDTRFEMLEAKIESAGLRNFNTALAQEVAKSKRVNPSQ